MYKIKMGWIFFVTSIIAQISVYILFAGPYLEVQFYQAFLNNLSTVLFLVAVWIWRKEGKKYRHQKKTNTQMLSKELVEFLRNEIASGAPREVISSKLKLEGGWNDAQIDSGFLSLDSYTVLPNNQVGAVHNGYLHIGVATIVYLLLLTPIFFDYQNYNEALKVIKEGNQFARNHQGDDAIYKFELALKLTDNPKIVSLTNIMIAMEYVNKQNYTEALAHCNKAVLVIPKITLISKIFAGCEQIDFILVQDYMKEGDIDQAILILNELIQTKKSDYVLGVAHLYLGIIYRYDHQDDDKAKEHCQTGIDLNNKGILDRYLNKDSKGNNIIDICKKITNGQ